MTFRFFIFSCALCGAWAAWFSWWLGRQWVLSSQLAEQAYKGLCLGFCLALGLSVLDALWNTSWKRVHWLSLRVLFATVIGTVGGLLGGALGQGLYGRTQWRLSAVFGWTLTGLLIGASLGMFDLFLRLYRNEDLRGARRKVRHGALGGTLGGFLGGLFYVFSRVVWSTLFRDKQIDQLWTPSATGFVILGLCIGLLIGLAQVVLREAWVRIEQGRRAGRELLLTKQENVLGRAEACDVGLFGDAGVEKLHARIVQTAEGYLLFDLDSPTGTLVNQQRISAPTRLHAGDLIQIGNYVLRFGEKQKG